MKKIIICFIKCKVNSRWKLVSNETDLNSTTVNVVIFIFGLHLMTVFPFFRASRRSDGEIVATCKFDDSYSDFGDWH